MFIVPITPMAIPSAEPVQSQRPSAASQLPFADVLSNAMGELQQAQAVSKQDAYDLAVGRADDFHTIMIHSSQATAALELTVQLATRAVSAYKEIMQMQV